MNARKSRPGFQWPSTNSPIRSQINKSTVLQTPDIRRPSCSVSIPSSIQSKRLGEILSWQGERPPLHLHPALAARPRARSRSSRSNLSDILNSRDPNPPYMVLSANVGIAYNVSPGNAFGSEGFWATQGLCLEPKSGGQEERRRNSGDSWLSNFEELEDTTRDSADASAEDTRVLQPSYPRSDPKGSFFGTWGKRSREKARPRLSSDTCKSSVDFSPRREVVPPPKPFLLSLSAEASSFGSVSKEGFLGTTEPYESNRTSLDTYSASEASTKLDDKWFSGSTLVTVPSLVDCPLSTNDFSTSLPQSNTHRFCEAHPFIEFDIPNDPVLVAAHRETREAIIAYFRRGFGNVAPSPTLSNDSDNSVITVIPKPSTELVRPTLRAKASSFFKRAPVKPNQGTDEEFPSSPVKLSKMPKSVKSKKAKNDMNRPKSDFGPSSAIATSQRVLEASYGVLSQMYLEFERIKTPLHLYMTTKPYELELELLRHEVTEDLARDKYSIKTPSELEDFNHWVNLLNPRTWDHPDRQQNLHNPVAYEYETIFDQQRQSIVEMTHGRSKAECLKVPIVGMRLIWAMRYAEWAEKNHERAIEECEERVKATRCAEKLKPLRQGMSLEPSEPRLDVSSRKEGSNSAMSSFSSSSESDSSHDATTSPQGDDLVYQKLLKDIEHQELDSPVSPVFPVQDESPEEARKRRRGTVFTGVGFAAPHMPTRQMSAQEMAKEKWELELEQALEREKERQHEWELERQKYRGSRGSGKERRATFGSE